MTHSVKNATDLYEAFHRYEPKRRGEFAAGFEIPARVFRQGRALDVLYRSPKTDPETLRKPRKPVDYIHDHDSDGVTTYLTGSDDASFDVNDEVATPDWIREAQALACLGLCLAFTFEDATGKPVKARGTEPLPELYAVQTGGWSPQAALLVIQSKREVIAIIWGGKLRVEPRGIVG